MFDHIYGWNRRAKSTVLGYFSLILLVAPNHLQLKHTHLQAGNRCELISDGCLRLSWMIRNVKLKRYSVNNWQFVFRWADAMGMRRWRGWWRGWTESLIMHLNGAYVWPGPKNLTCVANAFRLSIQSPFYSTLAIGWTAPATINQIGHWRSLNSVSFNRAFLSPRCCVIIRTGFLFFFESVERIDIFEGNAN